ncbi:MAG TPA: hypothetical protein VJQ77_08100 [Novosphingobium sp.]|nr:hypothetical protein [Novosphingobium sp.]
MNLLHRQWLASAAVVPQERGPEFLGIIDDAPWSEGLGFNRGFFSAFRVRAGKDVWFHWPFPTPVLADGRQLYLTGMNLLWEVADGARIGWITLQHGGMDRMELSPRQAAPDSIEVPFDCPPELRKWYPAVNRRLTRLALPEPLPLTYGVQLSVLVSAGEQDGTVRFYGAGADFGAA